MTATERQPATADTTALLDLNVMIALAWPQHIHHDRTSVHGNWQLAACRWVIAGQVTDFHLLALARATQSVLVTMDKAIPTCLAKSDKNLAELLS